MGLDVSHDAFSGAYSAFNRFRQAVCKAAGGSFPPHAHGAELDPECWYVADFMTKDQWPGLYVFLSHSDCDGEISPEDCVLVARDLALLIGKIAWDGGGAGHIKRDGGYRKVTERFIRGCLDAAEHGEPLEFR